MNLFLEVSCWNFVTNILYVWKYVNQSFQCSQMHIRYFGRTHIQYLSNFVFWITDNWPPIELTVKRPEPKHHRLQIVAFKSRMCRLNGSKYEQIEKSFAKMFFVFSGRPITAVVNNAGLEKKKKKSPTAYPHEFAPNICITSVVRNTTGCTDSYSGVCQWRGPALSVGRSAIYGLPLCLLLEGALFSKECTTECKSVQRFV